MLSSADKQLPKAQGASGLGKLLTGFLLGAMKPRSKGSLGEDNNFYFHPQLRRWLERGKEDACLTTTELPPPPMVNHGFDKAAGKRRSVSQRYKLQENLPVNAAYHITGPADRQPVGHPFLPMTQGCCTSMLLSPLCQPEVNLLHMGPASSSSDCSSADSSPMPSTRSSSSVSLTNGDRVALGGSSASSSRAGSACGSTDDTASSSPEVADESDFHDFLALAAPFSGVAKAGHPRAASPSLQLLQSETTQLLSPPREQMNASGGDAASVSILCTVDSVVLTAANSAVLGQSGVGAKQLGGETSLDQAETTAVALPMLLPQEGPCDFLCHEDLREIADGADFGEVEGSAALSRSSSLALSFSDLVHYDSFSEADLHLREPQQQYAAHARDVSDVLGTAHQQQQQQRGGEKQGLVPCNAACADAPSAVDDAFSFSPVFAVSGLSEVHHGRTGCVQACAHGFVEAGASFGAAAVADRCRWIEDSCWKQGSCASTSVCSSDLHTVRAAVLPQGNFKATADSMNVVGMRSTEPSAGQMHQSVYSPCVGARQGHQQAVDLIGGSPQPFLNVHGDSFFHHELAQNADDGDRTSGSRLATKPCITGTPLVVDLIAVDSAVKLLKQLSGSLLTAATCPVPPRVQGCEVSSAGSGTGAATGVRPAAQPVGSPPTTGVLAASLAQAAQKLASLGLLSAPPKRDVGRAAASAVKPPCVPCADAPSSLPRVVADPGQQKTSRHTCLSGPEAVAVSGARCGLAENASPKRAVAYREDGAAAIAQPGDTPVCAVSDGGVLTEQAGSYGVLASMPRCRALLKRMRADWARLQDQIGGMVGDYSALAKQVAATLAKQVVLERRCKAMEEGKVVQARQLQREREQREALGRQLDQERAQREALKQQLEQERVRWEGLVQQQQQLESEREREWERSSAREQEAETLQRELDELLLCLGQESTKVSRLAEALRAAGGDPDGLIEQVESEFVVHEAGPQTMTVAVI